MDKQHIQVDLYLLDEFLHRRVKYNINVIVDLNEFEIPSFFESKVPLEGKKKGISCAFVPKSKQFKLMELSTGDWGLFPGSIELTEETVSFITRIICTVILREEGGLK